MRINANQFYHTSFANLYFIQDMILNDIKCPFNIDYSFGLFPFCSVYVLSISFHDIIIIINVCGHFLYMILDLRNLNLFTRIHQIIWEKLIILEFLLLRINANQFYNTSFANSHFIQDMIFNDNKYPFNIDYSFELLPFCSIYYKYYRIHQILWEKLLLLEFLSLRLNANQPYDTSFLDLFFNQDAILPLLNVLTTINYSLKLAL